MALLTSFLLSLAGIPTDPVFNRLFFGPVTCIRREFPLHFQELEGITMRLKLSPIIIPGVLLLHCILFISGCRPQENTIVQYSTIDALLAGSYDGFARLGALDQAGNMGIGTFDALDGEMILVDDQFWKAGADGSLVRMDLDATTPFASVCEFSPEIIEPLEPAASLKDLTSALDSLCPDQNGLYAVRIDGEFGPVKTRSVPAQQKPYPPLAEVTRNQPEFHRSGSAGTIVGFRLPPYIEGLNVPGWHLHYLSNDRAFGGHLLELEMKNGTCGVDKMHRLTIELDESGEALSGLDLTRDRSEDLRQVEGMH